MKSPYYSKKWMSNPEEWFAEYSNIVNRLTGKVVPVSDLSPTNKKLLKSFLCTVLEPMMMLLRMH